MKTLIIEDELPASRRLKSLIEEISTEIEVLAVLDSIEESVKWLNDNPKPDLIFLDIQLADGLSFEIFEQVEVSSSIIFTTAFDDYTLQAFKVNSIDYLLKPIDKEELQKSIEKFEQLKTQFSKESHIQDLLKYINSDKKDYKSRFLVKFGDKLLSILSENIAYFYAEDKIVLLITLEGKKYAIDYTLDQLESLLNPSTFFRLNRKFIAHFQAIGQIHQYFKGKLKIDLIPKTEQEIIVSREKSPLFKKWLNQ